MGPLPGNDEIVPCKATLALVIMESPALRHHGQTVMVTVAVLIVISGVDLGSAVHLRVLAITYHLGNNITA